MKAIKVSLIVLFVLVCAVFTLMKVQLFLSNAKDGPTLSCPETVLDVSVADDRSYYLTGITASDRQDGDLTHRVLISGVSKMLDGHTARVNFLVFDKDNNAAQASRIIHFTDYRSPRFQVNSPLVFASTATAAPLKQISADDCIDSPQAINALMRQSSLRASDRSDVYFTTVMVTNRMGDTASVELPIIIRSNDRLVPVIVLKSQLVYLNRGDKFDARSYIEAVEDNTGALTIYDVAVNNPVDMQTPGTYHVSYTCENSYTASISILTVVVTG